jgi:hypothetical protein
MTAFLPAKWPDWRGQKSFFGWGCKKCKAIRSRLAFFKDIPCVFGNVAKSISEGL